MNLQSLSWQKLSDSNLFLLSQIGTSEDLAKSGKSFNLSQVYRDGTQVLICQWQPLFPKLEGVCSAAIHRVRDPPPLSTEKIIPHCCFQELFPSGPALLTAPAGWLRRKGHEKVNSFTAISWAILILSLKMDGSLQLNLLLIVHRRSWVVPMTLSIGQTLWLSAVGLAQKLIPTLGLASLLHHAPCPWLSSHSRVRVS